MSVLWQYHTAFVFGFLPYDYGLEIVMNLGKYFGIIAEKSFSILTFYIFSTTLFWLL